MERSLIILKPDTIHRGLAGRILARFESKGLKIVAAKMITISRELAQQHYCEHVEKPFFEDLVNYITSGPVMLMIWDGPSAITVIRQIVGATDGRKALPGTIRGDFAISIRYNLIHASDSPQAAAREINLFFKEDEIVDYDRVIQQWSWPV